MPRSPVSVTFDPNPTVKDYTVTHPYQPERVYKPASIDELVSAVREAESRGKKIKAQGSGYSLSLAAVADDDLICTDSLNHWLSLPEPNVRDAVDKIGKSRFLAGARETHLKQLRRSDVPINDVSTLIYVEAGIKIKKLLADLDALNLALPTMGAGGGQSLAGATSTGTHGSDFHLAPLHERIRAVHLVGPGGQEWWIEPTFGPIGGPHLAALPWWSDDIKVVRNDQWLHAAIVSVGRFGVIYAVVLDVVPQFRLVDQSEKGKTWIVARAQLQATALALHARAAQGEHDPIGVFVQPSPFSEDFPLRFFQVTVDLAKGTKCWISRRWRTASTEEQGVEGGEEMSSFDSILCSSPGKFGGALAGLQATPEFQGIRAATLAVPFAGGPWMIAIDALIAELIGMAASSPKVGDFLAGVAARLRNVNEGSHGPMAGQLRKLILELSAVIIDSQHADQKIGKSHQIVDGHPDNRRGCISAYSTEFFFDAAKTAYLDFVDRVLEISTEGGIPGYASLRFVSGSHAFLAMERFRWTVAIEIAVPRRLDKEGDVFAGFISNMQAAARNASGIPHWGQRMEINATHVEQYYGPSLLHWRDILARIEYRRKQTFRTGFSHHLGLEASNSDRILNQDAQTAAALLTG